VSIPREKAVSKGCTPARIVASGLEVAWENVAVSVERLCLTAGMEQDATARRKARA
jgi:hypothetical protein